MTNKRNIMFMAFVCALTLSTWNSAEPSWAFDPLGQIKDVGTSVTTGATEGIIRQLEEAKNKAKAELQSKLEKEMRSQLEKGFKTLDEEFEKKVNELKG